MQELKNCFSFSQNLVDDAVAFKHGNFVEVDDMLYEKHNLGRKIMQTQFVNIGGKEVSVGVTGDDAVPRYELIVASDNPTDLGSLESIMSDNKNIFLALQQAFGGSPGSFTVIEMVIAIRATLTENLSPSDDKLLAVIAADARATVKRGGWIASNQVPAFAKAHLDWRSLGL